MKKNFFFHCIIAFGILVCSSFKAAPVLPDRSPEIQLHKKRVRSFVRPFEAQPDIIAQGYQYNAPWSPNGNAVRVFHFPTLSDEGLPPFYNIRVENFGTPNEWVIESWLEYNTSDPLVYPNFYYHGTAGGWGSTNFEVWGVFQIVSPSLQEWEVKFTSGGTPTIYWYRTQ